MERRKILKGCIVKDSDNVVINKIDFEAYKDEVNSTIANIKNTYESLLSKKDEEVLKKLEYLEKFETNIKSEYEKMINECKTEVETLKDRMDEEFKTILQKEEEYFSDYRNTVHEATKDMIITLFEKFFYKEFDNIDNIESMIIGITEQIDTDKDIKISMRKDIYEKFLSNNSSITNNLLKENASLSIEPFNKKDIIFDINTDKGSIEMDLNVQFDKIKDILKVF